MATFRRIQHAPDGLTRSVPGYRTQRGGAGGSHPILDLSTVLGKRTLIAGIALAYIVGFHLSLGRFRVNFGGR